MEVQSPLPTARNYAIDLLRFLAALAVMLFHFTYRGYMADNLSPVGYPVLGTICKYGYLGVELFFVISGYVVLMSAMGKTVRQFLVSRITRLYPAFWVAVTLTFLVLRLLGPAKGSPGWSFLLDASFRQYAGNLTMLQQFLGVRDLDGVYWTLTVEVTFYFLVSLLLAYRLTNRIGLLLLAWLAYAWLAGSLPATTPFSFLFFPQFAPFFIGGMLLYLRQINYAAAWKLYTLLLFALALALRNGLARAKTMEELFHDSFSPVVVAFTILAIFAALTLITHGYVTLQRFRWLATLGALTYPAYLLHHNMGYVLLQRLHPVVDKYVLLLGLTGGTLLAAYLLHTLVERRVARPLGQWLSLRLATLASAKAQL